MISKIVLDGQCSDCVNAPTCTYVQPYPRRFFECDEYVSIRAIELEDERIAPIVAEGDGTEASLARTNGRLGLCSTCALCETCTFSSTESGVWHCDEYC